MSIKFNSENCDTVLELHKKFVANQTAHYPSLGEQFAIGSLLITLGGLLTDEQLAWAIKMTENSMSHTDNYFANTTK